MSPAFFDFSMYPQMPEEEEPDLGQTMRGVVGGTQLFQRFTLQKVLGRGGMGVVWLARDDRLERLVALKLVPEAVCFDPSAREDLKRETRKSLLLTHPNIVRIFDFIEDEQTAAICMEYVDGTTLSYARVHKRSKCFGIPELVPWITSLCDALAYAHESVGLVHRDLKPANMMVNSRAELKVTDFGIACSLRDSMSRVSVRTSSGTMNYMSPQQMLGEDPSPSDDIYALGATLYEMLSSKPPFYSGDVASQVREVIAPTIAQRRVTLGIAGEPIPKHWEETIAACLAKRREQRPRGATEVASRLRLGGTIRLTTAREIAKPVFQRYLKIGALAAGVAALLTAALLYRSNSTSQRAAVLSALKKEAPTGYALEAPVKNVPAPKTDEAPAPVPVSNSTAEPQNATLQLVTTPAGATFAIYPGVVAGKTAPATAPLRTGVTPESVADLLTGRYTIFFHNPGWPDDRAEISLQPGETLPVEYTFPHGSAMITSTPDGAEIFAGENSLGHTPLTVDLPLGKQELIARHPDFPKKSETVTIGSDTPAKIVFQLRARSHSSSKHKEPESAWGKFGNSLKKVFSSKPPPKKKRNQ
ncbi:MAG: eukaryotic-like serine/threonine-protein kinase [Verrucomicrobiota bacterium]|jgi:serine/threonine protein kinase